MIFAGNLPPEMTENSLQRLFSGYGKILSVTISDDADIHSGHCRCYAYIEMANKDEGLKAIEWLDGRVIGDRTIQVIAGLPLTNRGENLNSGKTPHRPSRHGSIRSRRHHKPG